MSPEITQRLKDLNTRMLNIVGYLIIKYGVTDELKALEIWLNDNYERLKN